MNRSMNVAVAFGCVAVLLLPCCVPPSESHLVGSSTRLTYSAAMADEAKRENREVKSFKHQEAVIQLVYSGDGKRIAVATKSINNASRPNASITIWDIDSGKEIRQIRTNDAFTYGIALSPDGKQLAVASPNEEAGVAIFDLNSGQVVQSTKVNGYVTSIAYSPDGKLLALSGSRLPIFIWKIGIGKPSEIPWAEVSHNFPGDTPLAFSPDGTTLAAANGFSSIVQLIDVETKTEKARLKERSRVPSLAFFPDGKRLAVGQWMEITEWDLVSAKRSKVLATEYGARTGISISRDGKLLVFPNSSRVGAEFWLTASSERWCRLRSTDHKGPAETTTLALSPDGSHFAYGGIDGLVKIWELGNPPPVVKNALPSTPDPSVVQAIAKGQRPPLQWQKELNLNESGYTYSLAFLSGGKTLVTGEENGKLQWWDVATGKHLYSVNVSTKLIRRLSLSPDGNRLLCISRSITIWDPYKCAKSASLAEEYEWCAAWVPNNNTAVAVAHEQQVKLIDVGTNKVIGELQRHTGQGKILGMSFSSDGKLLASIGGDKVIIWDMIGNRRYAEIPCSPLNFGDHWYPVLFTKDGKYLVFCSGGGIGFWSLTDKAYVRERGLHLGINQTAKALTFSPNEETLAAAGSHNPLLFDQNTRKGTLVPGFVSMVMDLAYSPDGDILGGVSPASKFGIRLWEVSSLTAPGNNK